MNTAIKHTSLLLVLSLFMTGCGEEKIKGEGTPKLEKRELQNFTGINIDGTYQVSGEIGPKNTIVITSNPNLLPYIETDISSDILHVANKASYELFPDTRQLISFTTPQFDSLTLSGATTFQFNNVNTEKLTISLTGSHKLFINGKATEVVFTSSGTTNVNAKDLSVSKATVKLNGSGQIAISPTDELNVEINGSGTVVYFGKEPKKITSTINGQGKVMNGFGGAGQQLN